MSSIHCPGLWSLPALLLAGAVCAQTTATAAAVEPARQQALLRMVRQDCGACHGMQLTGGLGPAITPQALAQGERSPEGVFATIWYGRPGTPMPPWRGLLSEAEARWMSAQLLAGLPPLSGGTR
ncbi:MAG: cytochrome c [Rubrivivax sp.]